MINIFFALKLNTILHYLSPKTVGGTWSFIWENITLICGTYSMHGLNSTLIRKVQKKHSIADAVGILYNYLHHCPHHYCHLWTLHVSICVSHLPLHPTCLFSCDACTVWKDVLVQSAESQNISKLFILRNGHNPYIWRKVFQHIIWALDWFGAWNFRVFLRLTWLEFWLFYETV
jgi:hypothetical protein